MGRFSEALAKKAAGPEPFLVDNQFLKSHSRGLKYRCLPGETLRKKGKELPMPWEPMKIEGGRESEAASIMEGTQLTTMSDCQVWRSVDSAAIIGVLKEGEHIEAAGAAKISAGFDMVPIRPHGAVQLSFVELRDVYLKRNPGVAEFGSIVRGFRYGNEWLQVGDLFLPFKVGDIQVLTPAWWDDTGNEEPRHEKTESRKTAWLVEAERLAEEDGVVNMAHKEGGKVSGASDLSNKRGKKPNLSAFETSFLEPGTGAMYEVVRDSGTVSRSMPSQVAKIENVKDRGDTIELFGWDETLKWRRCLDKIAGHYLTGWMLLDHPDVGPLVRPVGFPVVRWAGKPLHPMCAAIFENDLELVKKLITEYPYEEFPIQGGPSSIEMAVHWGRLDCCVLFLDAGADVSRGLSESETSLIGKQTESENAHLARVLLRALSGGDFHALELEAAMELLSPEGQVLADRLFDRVVEKLKLEDDDELANLEKLEGGERKNEPEERGENLALELDGSTVEFTGHANGAHDDQTSSVQPHAKLSESACKYAEFDTSQWQRGAGVKYEVVTKRAVIRAKPDAEAKVENYKVRGETLELFEWDPSWCWRRCVDEIAGMPLKGWIRMDHPKDNSPLVRPVGFPMDAEWARKPLNPMCAAIFENDLLVLKELIAQDANVNANVGSGLPLLSVAVNWGCLDACVLLLQAGANPNQGLEYARRHLDTSPHSDTARVLVMGIVGEAVGAEDRFAKALRKLHPEVQLIADKIITAKSVIHGRKEDDGL